MERRNAAIERYESENDIVKHIETEVEGYPQRQAVAIALSTAGKSKSKPVAKSPSGTKKGGSSKKVFSDSKAAKI